MKKDTFKVANKRLKSRLIVGTGKYKNFKETAKAVKESGADMVTVAVRRINILDKRKPILTDYLNPKKIIYLINSIMAKIQLNGKKVDIKPKATVYELLKKFNLNNKKVAIEHNGIIIPKVNYKKKYLKNNDKLEVVHFIGGG